jgi:signal transduction histidine kinase
MIVQTGPPVWSLARRLGWRLAAVMVAAILLAAGAVAWRTIATVHALDDSALQNQADLIARSLSAIPNDAKDIALPEELVAPFRASDGDNLFVVYDRNGRLVATSDPREAAQLAPIMAQPMRMGFFRLPSTIGHERGMLGLVTAIGPWRVVVLQGREQTAVLLDSLMGNFLVGAIWLLIPIGVATVLIGVLTLRQGLRPLLQVSAAAALVGPSQPGVRLPVTKLPREVAPLVAAVNEALARLEQALAAQRRFVAEAAHALRTPLAVLTARLDMLDGRPEVVALRHDSDRMARLVGQLLRMARLEGLPLNVTHYVELRAVAVEAITSLAPLAVRSGVELALLEDQVCAPVFGNHAALVLALTNLIENAISHAPSGSAVELKVTPPATIAVADRGPGVPVEHRERIFGRFERGVTPCEGGAGLGLAIVAEIAAAHGGMVRVTGRANGGAIFLLTLGQIVSDRRSRASLADRPQ